MASCSLLVINYRSAALALDAIATARTAFRGELQVVVVDNSLDPAEAELLSDAGQLIVADRNLGYAGAINAGRKRCDGETILVVNPDVRFASGSIDRLLDLDAAVAGPALFWDDAFEWMLPPADVHSRRQVLDRVLATRSSSWAIARDRRRTRERIRFWSLTESRRVSSLSGAVMAIRASAFDLAGGFDERYPLYFEEHDFLRRVSGPILYVPQARVRHLYNQSAAGSPEAASSYAISEARYLEKWGGRLATVLKRAERHLTPRHSFLPFPPSGIALRDQEAAEASPLADFDTAAGCFPRSRTLTIPDDIWRAYRGVMLYIRVVDQQTGATVAAFAKDRMAG